MTFTLIDLTRLTVLLATSIVDCSDITLIALTRLAVQLATSLADCKE